MAATSPESSSNALGDASVQAGDATGALDARFDAADLTAENAGGDASRTDAGADARASTEAGADAAGDGNASNEAGIEATAEADAYADAGIDVSVAATADAASDASDVDAGDGGPTIVYSNGFETSAPSGPWQVDNSQAHSGTNSAHPPILMDAGNAALTLDCGGLDHSKMSFWYLGAPSAGQSLGFYVDGTLYQTFGSTNVNGFYSQWMNFAVVVPTGTHSYEWIENAASGGSPGFWLDDISCSYSSTSSNTTGIWTFDQGFVPPEITGTFEVDNENAQCTTNTASCGGGSLFSAHPPSLGANGTSTMSFSCGGRAHSSLSFWYIGSPAAGEALNFYEDGVLYHTYGSTNINGFYSQWMQVTLLVSSGMHSYQWTETAANGGPPGFWIDTIACQ